MRQIVLDTETTGLDPAQGHRIIEIGCVEMVNRRLTQRHFHYYLQPDRQIDAGAMAVHGITHEFLQDKPRFADIVAAFMDFVKDAELIIHNAPFDVGFINAELARLNQDWPKINEYCAIIDTLSMARKRHPGQKNNLDALCKRYQVNNEQRTLHGALLDAEILAEVYLAMTGGQVSLLNTAQQMAQADYSATIQRVTTERTPLPILLANEEEQAAHEKILQNLDKSSGGTSLWRSLSS
ncbi:DNA polymerase III subunit epsilon [Thioflexithrix psekupsensis]|uniref:DNA polymerase III subunit epsilon n=1 Tax=Thioflexithrix psekupsensis TaxID=1570016 RepID=A0A251X714_9GAMM|nr:DNA polymerase III subunit epsilon [Thioflexithrix psekupsensis]OUD13174.1 DNA polymerase III subunit epsilon [Thioflexithrix psekupsensis]